MFNNLLTLQLVTTDQLQLLRSLSMAVFPLKEEEWEAFSKPWNPVAVQRKELITQGGQTEKYLYVVLEGIQRVYYSDEQGREATLVFTYAPSFGGVLDSFLLQQPSRYEYEALTGSLLLRASYTDIEQLMNEHKGIEVLVRKGVTIAMSGVLERLVELQSFSAEERFRTLLKRSPHILQLIPHKYLANYLGMDATNFSKLLNKIRID